MSRVLALLLLVGAASCARHRATDRADVTSVDPARDAAIARGDAGAPTDAASRRDSGVVAARPAELPRDWLGWVNHHRALAGIAPVEEEPELSEAALDAARYIVRTDTAEHRQDPDNAYYSQAGDRAARRSILLANRSALTAVEVIDYWATAPLHAIGMLDPGLEATGYGQFSEPGGAFGFGAALDVLTERRTSPVPERAPLTYPGDGAEHVVTRFVSEYPDPLTSCPGYSAPSGAPILVFVDSRFRRSSITSSGLERDGEPVEHCVFDWRTYLNPDRELQRLARDVLEMRGAVVMMPREPLVRGATYRASLRIAARRYSWQFRVAAWAR